MNGRVARGMRVEIVGDKDRTWSGRSCRVDTEVFHAGWPLID